MFRKICLILILFLILTGCQINKIDDDSFDSVIRTILYNDYNLSNVNFEGFKLYLPRGTNIIDKNDYNLKIKDNDYNYYLHVDAVSYYYKTVNEHEVDNTIFYSSNLSYKRNYGYIDITQVEDKYFIEIMYNYAKIEAYVLKEDLYDSFLNISYILSSIKFNDYTIGYKLNNKQLDSTAEKFDIFSAKKNNDNFLQYIEEFDKYESNSNNNQKDQDIIETD